MTVRKLIAELRRMPQGAKVCVVAHDQNPEVGEFDGPVQHVDEATDSLGKRGFGVMISL